MDTVATTVTTRKLILINSAYHNHNTTITVHILYIHMLRPERWSG